MRVVRFIFVPWTIFLVYSFFTAVLGQNGFYAQKHLEAEKVRLAENYRALEMASSDFLKTKESLMHDQDALSVYARQLGYGRQNEEFIRIMGLGVAINNDMSPGQVLYAANPVAIPDRTIKILAILFGVAAFILFLINDFFSYKSDRD